MNTRYLEDLIKELEKQEELWIEEMELDKKKEDVWQEILSTIKKIQNGNF